MSNLTVAIISVVVNLLVLIIVGLVAYIGKGTHRRIDALKQELKEYQTEKVCKLLRETMRKDIDNIGKLARGEA